MKTDGPKLCIDCRHFEKHPDFISLAMGVCARTRSISLVDGSEWVITAGMERAGDCGPGACYFEAIKPPVGAEAA